jgi:2-polyprenyl-3-methyl-5-hydroxy-6-metoxy-1,4-benzoquinol methylase
MIDVKQLYSHRFENQQVIERKNLIWQTLCKYYFQRLINSSDTVVDIAAGYCEFINNIRAKKKICFDLNPDMKEFADKDVVSINDSFFNMGTYIEKNSADVIFASNILEHLDNKDMVVQAIRLCAEHLSPHGGRLMILCPNIRYAKAAYWDFIDHKVALTDRALIEVAEMCGLRIKYRLPRFLPYSTKSGLPQHPFFVWLFLKLMPLSAWLMGKQSFFILERKA